MSCQKPAAVVVVGGSGLVGRVLVQRWRAKLNQDLKGNSPTLISLDLRPNPDAAVNVVADLCDPKAVEQALFAKYDVHKMIIAVKPPLIGPSYQFFIEVNLAGICELVKLAEQYKVGSLLYVSSLASCSHWVEHDNIAESDPSANPPFTDLRSPYDLSKAMAEQFILQRHSASGMRTVSIRIAGVYAHDHDQYWNRRLPFNLSLEISDVPTAPRIDSNYVENVAEGLLRVSERLSEDATVGGRFYFYTIGDRRVGQQELSIMLAARAGKFHIQVPPILIKYWLKVMTVLASLPLLLPGSILFQPQGRAVQPKPYFTTYSMSQMGVIDQTFDNSLFRKTFGFSHTCTTEEAADAITEAARQSSRIHQQPNYKNPSVLDLVFGPLILSLILSMFTAVGAAAIGIFSCSVMCTTACASPLMCSAANGFVAFSSPATHVLGFATQPTYKLWQPFRGGRLHVYLQGAGWIFFSVMVLQWFFGWLVSTLPAAPVISSITNDQVAMITDDRIKAVLGCISQICLTVSLFAFRGHGEAKRKVL